MNTDNLHELIDRYETKIDKIYSAEHDELFKWRAMKTWRDEWFKPEESFPSFAERFTAAKKDFSLFIDNSRMHPSSGVLKLWEKEPKIVEHLFRDVLFGDTGGDVSVAQDRMDSFLDAYEALRQKYYPGNWSYKQDRHSVSVYLAMNMPEFHYVYKSSEALTMAKYIDFGFNIGAGTYFSLENYYKLEVVEQDGMMVSELQLKGHETPIEALEGVFVQANAENQTFSFVTSMPQGGNGEGLLNVRVTLTGRGSTVDQAMVRFGQGDELGKFMLHEHGTKLYIPQGNKDCAMVHVGNNGETPINFHVAKNGNYTITVMPEAVEMNYLHLIDNMTGADIDLLTNPSYSFEACTSDYESRFRLVYSMKEDNPSSDADTFAYYNGSAWVVSNMGESTLQVVDILGRIVSSKQINGNATISTADLDAGAYVMRLINGNDVKVQKVIIR